VATGGAVQEDNENGGVQGVQMRSDLDERERAEGLSGMQYDDHPWFECWGHCGRDCRVCVGRSGDKHEMSSRHCRRHVGGDEGKLDVALLRVWGNERKNVPSRRESSELRLARHRISDVERDVGALCCRVPVLIDPRVANAGLVGQLWMCVCVRACVCVCVCVCGHCGGGKCVVYVGSYAADVTPRFPPPITATRGYVGGSGESQGGLGGAAEAPPTGSVTDFRTRSIVHSVTAMQTLSDKSK
jgi:hypothetical protein